MHFEQALTKQGRCFDDLRFRASVAVVASKLHDEAVADALFAPSTNCGVLKQRGKEQTVVIVSLTWRNVIAY